MNQQRRNKAGWKAIPWVFFMFTLFLLAMIALALEQLLNIFAGRIYHITLKWLKENYYYYAWLERDLADCESILELGCGAKSPLLHIGYGGKTDAVDIFKPYIKNHNHASSYHQCWLADILAMDLPQKAYDAVVMFDVLEHLPREKVEAIDLFSKMEKCARKKVIIFAPNGFIENDLVDGDPYQEHVSAWEPEDYKKRSYKIVGGTGLRYLFGKASLPKRPQIVFYTLGMLSQPLIYHFPKLAWHSYAVKDVR